uniref:Uncharacterized protein n=1 Tax=Biomphalaria glabrata TaxID=6526 RepID=A0A2C9KZK5_BIOGL
MSHRYTSGSYNYASSDTRKSSTLSSPLSSSGNSRPLRSAVDTTTRTLATTPLLSLGGSSLTGDRRGVTSASSSRVSYSRTNYLSPTDALSSRVTSAGETSSTRVASSSREALSKRESSFLSSASSSRVTDRRQNLSIDDSEDKKTPSNDVRHREVNVEEAEIKSDKILQNQSNPETTDNEPRSRRRTTVEAVERDDSRPSRGWRSRLMHLDFSSSVADDNKTSSGTTSRKRADELGNIDRQEKSDSSQELTHSSELSSMTTRSVSRQGQNVYIESSESKMSVEKNQHKSQESLDAHCETKKVRDRRAYGKKDSSRPPQVVSDIKIITSFHDVTEDKQAALVSRSPSAKINMVKPKQKQKNFEISETPIYN